MIPTGKILALIDIDRDVEFSGDDVDRYTKLVDLGGIYKFVEVTVPALSASAAVDLFTQEDKSIDTVPSQFIALVTTAAGHYVPSTTSGAGTVIVVFGPLVAQYVRVRAGANQSADRNFYVRGFN